jgi:uncharacterized protein
MRLLDSLDAATRQTATLEEVEHRPWPLPEGHWAQAQTWQQLLFAHWQVPADALRALVPPTLELDTFDGNAYVGVTPFQLTGLRLRGLPPAPVVSSFLELNCRTYVSHGGKPGIWFFSLDASSRLAVAGARRLYSLPYFHARMSRRAHFTSVRLNDRDEHVWDATHEPEGPTFQADEGTLEYFLAERYCLYAVSRGSLSRAEIHHRPWPLQRARAEIFRNSIPPRPLDVTAEPHLMFAARQDVLIWPLEPAD